MASSAGTRRPRRARRWVGGILAVVLLPLGIALLLYSFAPRSDAPNANAVPNVTLSPSVVTLPMATAAPTDSDSSDAPPGPTSGVVTRYIAVTLAPSGPASEGPDVLALVTTISGLVASVAGIVSAVVSARAARRP